MITDKGLQMNAYADSKFQKPESSLNPPKSFNKVINLNLLTSKNFTHTKVEKKKTEEDDPNEKINEINNYIQKSMQFYSNIVFNSKR